MKEKFKLGQEWVTKVTSEQTPEQIAREMLYRMGVKDALSWSSGEVLLLANLIADYRRLGGEI